MNIPYSIKKIESKLLKFGNPGDKIQEIFVRDKLNRYLQVPEAEKQPNGNFWIETLPLCREYYCKNEDLNEYINWFENKNCTIESVKTKIIPQTWYKIIYVLNTLNTLNTLFKSLLTEPKKVVPISFQMVELADPYREDSIISVNRMHFPRWFDAYSNFENVAKIVLNDVEITSLENFTDENPLILKTFDTVLLYSCEVSQPVKMHGIFYNAELRKNLIKN